MLLIPPDRTNRPPPFWPNRPPNKGGSIRNPRILDFGENLKINNKTYFNQILARRRRENFALLGLFKIDFPLDISTFEGIKSIIFYPKSIGQKIWAKCHDPES